MIIITDEYLNLRTFLLEPPSSPLTWAQASARWRDAHPDIAALFEVEENDDA